MSRPKKEINLQPPEVLINSIKSKKKQIEADDRKGLSLKISLLQWTFLHALDEEISTYSLEKDNKEIQQLLEAMTIIHDDGRVVAKVSLAEILDKLHHPRSDEDFALAQKQLERAFKRAESTLQTHHPRSPLATAFFKKANQGIPVVYEQVGLLISSPPETNIHGFKSFMDAAEVRRNYLCHLFDRITQPKFDTMGITPHFFKHPSGTKLTQGMEELQTLYKTAISDQRKKSSLHVNEQEYGKELIREMSDADIEKLYQRVNDKIEKNYTRVSAPTTRNKMLNTLGIRKKETMTEYQSLFNFAQTTDKLINPEKSLSHSSETSPLLAEEKRTHRRQSVKK